MMHTAKVLIHSCVYLNKTKTFQCEAETITNACHLFLLWVHHWPALTCTSLLMTLPTVLEAMHRYTVLWMSCRYPAGEKGSRTRVPLRNTLRTPWTSPVGTKHGTATGTDHPGVLGWQHREFVTTNIPRLTVDTQSLFGWFRLVFRTTSLMFWQFPIICNIVSRPCIISNRASSVLQRTSTVWFSLVSSCRLKSFIQWEINGAISSCSVQTRRTHSLSLAFSTRLLPHESAG